MQMLDGVLSQSGHSGISAAITSRFYTAFASANWTATVPTVNGAGKVFAKSAEAPERR